MSVNSIQFCVRGRPSFFFSFPIFWKKKSRIVFFSSFIYPGICLCLETDIKWCADSAPDRIHGAYCSFVLQKSRKL